LRQSCFRSNAPHAQDYPVLDRLAQIGFHVGERFDIEDADPVVQTALMSAVAVAQKTITDKQTRVG